VNQIKQTCHPNAYLKKIRNVKSGLDTRSKILLFLDNQGCSASKIAKECTLTYGVVMHHLYLLKDEGIVEKKGGRRFVWFSTGFGQKRLG
jgi:DNA-binding transcriptional ArsR family regulator